MVDKLVGKVAKEITKKGEEMAPVKSLKIKVKFQKAKGSSHEKALSKKK